MLRPVELGTLSLTEADRIDPEPNEVYALPASLGQERYWRLDRLKPGNPTWMVPVRFRLRGLLDVALVGRAFNEIVARHESLRTTFKLVDGQLFQVLQRSLEIEVPVTDLRHLAKPARDAEVDRLSFEEARRGFNLSVGPLFRVGLFQVEDDEHVLLVTPHHSIADYWSIGLISNELGALYEAYSRGTDPVLPQLPIQYADFAVWQREQAGNTVVQTELAYWKDQLRDLPLLEFPLDHPRPDFPTYDATITSLLLPIGLTDAIRDIAKRAGTTFFNTMLAALGIVLYRYTGQTDFGVGTQVAGRSSVELEPLIGLFINTVVLRLDLSGDPAFPQLLDRVQDVGLQSLANQNVRFEQLLNIVRPGDYPSHHTLFRVNFICQRDPVKPLDFSGIGLTVIPSKSQGALYDLNIFLVLRNEGWRLACEYNTDLFDATTISGLLENYRRVLESIVDNPSGHISRFPLLEGARKRTRSPNPPTSPSGEVTSANTGHPQSLGAAAAEQARPQCTVSATATLSQESTADIYVMPASVTQARFWMLEEILPGNPALHMRACVRVAGVISHLILEKSLQCLVDRHEVLRTTFAKKDDELCQIVRRFQPISLPVTSLEGLSEAEREASLWEAIRAEVSAEFNLVRGPLVRSHLFCLQPQENVLVVSTHHILTDGWSQNVIQRDLWEIYEALAEGRKPSLSPLAIQYADFVHWQRTWLASDVAREQLRFWKTQLAGPLPVLDFPTDPPSGNRPSSHGPMETLLLAEDLIRSLKKLGQSHEATMYMVLLTGYVTLLNRYTGQEDILVGSPVANRRSETEQLIGPFSGPVSLRLNLGNNPTLRELLARVRDVTLESLSHADLPFEVLLEELDVRSIRGRNPLSQCYFFYQNAFLRPRELPGLTVTPLPDFGLGTHFELQMGLLERREGVRAQLEYNPYLFEAGTIKEVLRSYDAVLRAFAADPERRLSDLPFFTRTSPEPASSVLLQSAIEVTPPQNKTEEQLRRIWEELLKVRPIGVHQDYFDLGGNSLGAVRLFARIAQVFDVKLPLSTLIQARTIEQLARILRGNDASPNWSPLVEIQAGHGRPRFFCVHGGGGNVLIYRDLSRHLGPDQPFYGLQSQGLDGEHPVLTRIESMAALYVKEIQRLQPHGPYFLGGYCMGGTVALEMAQQLKAQGEQVALLALFDTINWSRLTPKTAWNKAGYEMQRLLFHVGNFLLLGFKDRIRFLRAKFGVLRSRVPVWRGMLMTRLTETPRAFGSEAVSLATIWETNDEASVNYLPQPYPGVITDFRPMKQYARYKTPGTHWDDLALERQEIVTLPVYPAGMLLQPFVRQLAVALRLAIDKAAALPVHQNAQTPLPGPVHNSKVAFAHQEAYQ